MNNTPMRRIAALIILIIALPLTAWAQADPDLNDPDYWETQTQHPSQCFKHETGDTSVHGTITPDGLAVTLVEPFNPAWWGDHWELLVVKAGIENTIIDHPTAGVEYPTEQEVSHWVICKGKTIVTTTTETTQPTTTTETTAPPSTTSTTEPPTTTIGSTTTQPPGSSITASSSTSVPPTTLPETGIDGPLIGGYIIAALALVGLGILTVKRR